MAGKFRAYRFVALFLAIIGVALAFEFLPPTATMQSPFMGAATTLQLPGALPQTETNLSSVGTMLGVTPQRTHAFNTRGVNASPTSVLWRSSKLFSLKSAVYEMVEDGPFRFEIPLPTYYNYTTPILAGGAIYMSVYNGDGYIVALNASDGKLRNRYKNAGTSISAITVADGTIYVGGSNGLFYAFDLNTEQDRWQVRDNYSFDIASPVVASGIVYFSGARDKAMYVGSNVEGIIYAVDALTGKEIWKLKVKGYPTAAALDNGTVCFGDGDDHLYALDSRSGKEKWRLDAGSNISQPAIMNGSVFFRDSGGSLFAVDLNTGKLRWKTRKVEAGTLLAIDKSSIYLGGRYDSLYAIDAASGEQKWRFKTNKRCATPVLTEGMVYFGCLDKMLYATDAATGQEKWRYKNEQPIVISPIISDGTIYFLDGAAFLHAIR